MTGGSRAAALARGRPEAGAPRGELEGKALDSNRRSRSHRFGASAPPPRGRPREFVVGEVGAGGFLS